MSPTVFLVVFSQLVTKWRISYLADVTLNMPDRWSRLTFYMLDPYIVTCYASSFLASIAWLFVVERYEISNAFPIYIGLTILLVSIVGSLIFNEPLTQAKLLSIVLIIVGVIIGARS